MTAILISNYILAILCMIIISAYTMLGKWNHVFKYVVAGWIIAILSGYIFGVCFLVFIIIVVYLNRKNNKQHVK